MQSTESSILRLACPAYGGMLPIPPGQSEFVTCPFCGNNLQIRRSADGVILELAQQVDQAIGSQISTAIGQEVARARLDAEAQMRRQADEQRLQALFADVGRAAADYETWQRAAPSPQRAAALEHIHRQWVDLDYKYRVLYKQIHPAAEVDLTPPAMQAATQRPTSAPRVIVYPAQRPQIHVETYKNAKDYERGANKMLRNGWHVQGQSGTGRLTVTWARAGTEAQKGCPQCGERVPLSAQICYRCGFAFPPMR